MNPQSKWPLVCAGTVAGCLVGYVVGGGLSSSGGKSAGHRDSGGPEIVTPAARAIQPQALAGTADDGAKHGETALLSALREPNELRRAHDLFGVIDKMAPGDVAAAIALARRMPEQRWAGADPQAASAAVLALPPGDLRNRVLESVVESLGSRDVPAALRLIEQMPPGNARKDALGQISQRWASSDPQAAAQYVSALPPGDTQKRAVSSVAAVWARTDAGAPLAWTAQLPEGVAAVGGKGSARRRRVFDQDRSGGRGG